jgi:hypothetical protein
MLTTAYPEKQTVDPPNILEDETIGLRLQKLCSLDIAVSRADMNNTALIATTNEAALVVKIFRDLDERLRSEMDLEAAIWELRTARTVMRLAKLHPDNGIGVAKSELRYAYRFLNRGRERLAAHEIVAKAIKYITDVPRRHSDYAGEFGGENSGGNERTSDYRELIPSSPPS